MKGVWGISVGKLPGKNRLIWKNNNKINLKKIKCVGEDRIKLDRSTIKWWTFVNTVTNVGLYKTRNFVIVERLSASQKEVCYLDYFIFRILDNFSRVYILLLLRVLSGEKKGRKSRVSHCGEPAEYGLTIQKTMTEFKRNF